MLQFFHFRSTAKPTKDLTHRYNPYWLFYMQQDRNRNNYDDCTAMLHCIHYVVHDSQARGKFNHFKVSTVIIMLY